MEARALLFFGLLQSADAFRVLGVAARPAVSRSTRLVAFEGSDSVKLVRDALMNRAVEQQISSYGLVHNTARKTYLHEQWTQFLEQAQPQSPGSLTNFISHLQRSEVTSIFVPKRMFRQLSPGNPYAAQNVEGHHEEVRPTLIALSLISCREQLAEYWVELLPTLIQAHTAPDYALPSNANAVNATVVNATVADDYMDIHDKQLLFGIATKLAARQMLKDLSMRPSCAHLHEWLKSYLLVKHAHDLTARGSVERLHADLVRQPVCIRGGALVDPADLSLELFQRSIEILELIEDDLRAAPEHIVPLTASFLDSCLLL